MLITIRKILSNLTLQRINPKVNKYPSQSQSAYREGRSTTDIIWAYKWIIAKVQRQKGTKIFITGIDMTAAFVTILRKELLEDEIRMCRVLLSDTTISIRINNTTSELTKMNKVWIRGKKIHNKKRLKMYNTLAKPILTYIIIIIEFISNQKRGLQVKDSIVEGGGGVYYVMHRCSSIWSISKAEKFSR